MNRRITFLTILLMIVAGWAYAQMTPSPITPPSFEAVGGMVKSVYDIDENGVVDDSEDLTCTDCLDDTQIQDLYVLNSTDDSMAGVLSNEGLVVDDGAGNNSDIQFHENGADMWAIRNRASDDNFVIRKLVGGNTNHFIINTSGYLGIGNDPSSPLDMVFDERMIADFTGASDVADESTQLRLYRSRGGIGSQSELLDGDVQGQIRFGGWANGSYFTNAHINAAATENHDATSQGSELTFYTTPDGATSAVLAATINQDQSVDLHDDLVVEHNITGEILYFSTDSSAPASAIAHAPYSSDEDLTIYGGSPTGTLNGSAAVGSGTLNLDNDNQAYVRYDATDNFDSTQVGAILICVIPNYSGSPSSDQTFISISKDAGDNDNLIRIRHLTNGNMQLRCVDSTGGWILNDVSLGSFSPVSGNPYAIEFNFDFTAGESRLFINGTQLGSTQAATGTRDALIDFTVLGDSPGLDQTANFKVAFVTYFDAVQHTANFTSSCGEYGTDEIITASVEGILADSTPTAENGHLVFKTLETDDDGLAERLRIDQDGMMYFPIGTDINEFSLDDTLADDSDDAVPTEKAVKAYVDAKANLTVGNTNATIADTGSDGNFTVDIEGTNLITADANGFRISNVGYMTPIASFQTVIEGFPASWALAAYDNTPADSAILSMFHSRGTTGTPLATQSGDTLAAIAMGGYTGSALANGAWISSVASENWVHGSAVGTGITINHYPNTSISPVAAISIAGADSKVSLKNGIGINEFSNDDTLGDDSDDAVPTEQAVKAYVDGKANIAKLDSNVTVADTGTDGTITFTSDNVPVMVVGNGNYGAGVTISNITGAYDYWPLYVAIEGNLCSNYMIAHNDAVNGTTLNLTHTRGTGASMDYLDISDQVGALSYQGFNGATLGQVAGIDVFATENHSSGNLGVQMRFQTTADGTGTPATRMTIDSSGKVIVAGDFQVDGDTVSSDGATDIVGFSSVATDSGAVATVTVLASDSGTIFFNSQATEYDLPSNPRGLEYTFVVDNATALNLDPHTTDIFAYIGCAAGDRLLSSTPGDTITIIGINASDWAIKSIIPGDGDFTDSIWTDNN